MPATDTSRRLSPSNIESDIVSLNGLKSIPDYAPVRPIAAQSALIEAQEAMTSAQSEEDRLRVLYQAAADVAREAEWEFHNRVLAMKEAIRGQFGANSSQVQAVGLKRKSERKRPAARAAKVPS